MKHKMKNRIVNFIKGITIISFIGITLTAGGMAFLETKKIRVTSAQVIETVKEVTVDISDEKFEKKIKELQDEILDDLQGCESPGYTEEDGLVVWDDNSTGTLPKKDKLSYGMFQFKISTVQHYMKNLRGEDVNNYEAIQIALSENDSRELTRDVLFEKGYAGDWANCDKRLGLSARINIINKLKN